MKIKTWVILSMHRSASSLIAKALANEIDMGAVYRPIDDQPAGNWEDMRFVTLNEAILKEAGGSWDNPPSRESILSVSDKLKGMVRGLVEYRNEQGKFWGWKDPRTCLTIELYAPYLINPHYVHLKRDPTQVAYSLQRRNGFSIEKGKRLAIEYERRIVEFLGRRNEK